MAGLSIEGEGGSDRAVRRHRELTADVARAVRSHPRSQQRAIGPSEAGDGCKRRIALKLALMVDEVPVQTTVEEGYDRWYPQIGTAVHAWLEEAFGGQPEDYVTEQRVTVGEYDGQVLAGSSDLYDVIEDEVIDWKIVGQNTLRKLRAAGVPSDVYRAQIQLYARGQENAGRTPRWVTIAYLPRESGDVRDGLLYTEPYDRAVSERVLAELDELHRGVRTSTGGAFTRTVPTSDEGCRYCPFFVDVGPTMVDSRHQCRGHAAESGQAAEPREAGRSPRRRPPVGSGSKPSSADAFLGLV